MNTRGWFWCLFATFIVALSMAGTGWLIYSANSDPSFGVEPDYYSKALAWNDTAAQREANQRLNWSVVIGEGKHAGEVAIDVRDASGIRIEEARVTGIAFANRRSSERMELAAMPAEGGGFEARVPVGEGGSWHFRIRVERGTDVFTWEGDYPISEAAP
jgi:nitrogen fixation protein FixH